MDTSDTMAPWIGSAISSSNTSSTPSKRILILGESWYGPPVPLSTYLTGWCAGSIQDHFFSCIFHAASGSPASGASPQQRSAFWNNVIFDNFVNFPVGPSISHRPTPLQLDAAAHTFPARLAVLLPDSVWVIGVKQQQYSVPVLRTHHYHYVPSPHPRSGVTIVRLRDDWTKL